MNPLLLWKYRKVAAYVLLALLLVWVCWYLRHTGVMAERARWEVKVSEAREQRIEAYEGQLAAYKKRLTASEGDTADLSVKLADAQARTKAISDALSRARLTHETPVPGACPVVRLSRDFRLCITAATAGTAAATADCAASGVPVP